MTAVFWTTKVLTTGMGETTSDYLANNMNPVVAVGLAGIVLAGSLVLQFAVRRYVPWIYWLAVVMVSVVGTMVADVVHKILGVPYAVSAVAFAVLLAAVFGLWYAVERTLAIDTVIGRRTELFYWVTVMVTFALGTAVGDLTAATLGLGYLTSGVMFALLIAVPAVAFRVRVLGPVAGFWAAYVLTRPLGASFADWMGVGTARGGLDWGTGPVSLALAAVIAALVGVLTVAVGSGSMSRMRRTDELVDVQDPAWPLLLEEAAASPARPRLLPGDPAAGRACLRQLQVTARSFLGGVALNCGGLLFDGGWLRVYGSGCAELPGLAEVNGFPAEFDPAWHPEDGLVVGHDVLGGVFALNGHDPAAHGRPGEPGQVRYLAPDTLEWETLGTGYTGWLSWLLADGARGFYAALRWPGWEEETTALTNRQGITVYPFLWSEEAAADLAATSRAPVPMSELLGITSEFCATLGLVDPGFLGLV